MHCLVLCDAPPTFTFCSSQEQTKTSVKDIAIAEVQIWELQLHQIRCIVQTDFGIHSTVGQDKFIVLS